MSKLRSQMKKEFNFLDCSGSFQKKNLKSTRSKKPNYKKKKQHLKLNKRRINSNYQKKEMNCNLKNATAPPNKDQRFDWRESTKNSLNTNDHWTTGNKSYQMGSMSINIKLSCQNDQKNEIETWYCGKYYSFKNSSPRSSENTLSKRDSEIFSNNLINQNKPKKKIKKNWLYNLRKGVQTNLDNNSPVFFTFDPIVNGPKSLVLSPANNLDNFYSNSKLIFEVKKPENISSLHRSSSNQLQFENCEKNKFFPTKMNFLESESENISLKAVSNQKKSKEITTILKTSWKPQSAGYKEDQNNNPTQNQRMKNKRKLNIKMDVKKKNFGKERVVNSNQISSFKMNVNISPMIDSFGYFRAKSKDNFFKKVFDEIEANNERECSIPTSTFKSQTSFFTENSMEQLKSLYLLNPRNLYLGLNIRIDDKNQNPKQKIVLDRLKTMLGEMENDDLKINFIFNGTQKRFDDLGFDRHKNFKNFYEKIQTRSSAQLLEDLKFSRNYNLVLHNCYFTEAEISERFDQARKLLNCFLKSFLIRNLGQEGIQIQKIKEIVYKLFLLHLHVPKILFYSLSSVQRSLLFISFFFKMFNRKMVNRLITAKASRLTLNVADLFSQDLRAKYCPDLLLRTYLLMQLVRRVILNFKAIFQQPSTQNIDKKVASNLDIENIVDNLGPLDMSFESLVESVDLDDFQDFFIFLKHTNFNPKKLYQVSNQPFKKGFKVHFYSSQAQKISTGRESLENEEPGQTPGIALSFAFLSRKTMNFNDYRKIKKPSELYKKIQRNLNKIIGRCLNHEKNRDKLTSLEIHRMGQVPCQEVKYHFKISESDFKCFLKNKKQKANAEQADSLEEVNRWIQKSLKKNWISPKLLSAIKCTSLFRLYREEILGIKFLEKHLTSILDVDFFKRSCLNHFELSSDFFDGDEEFVWPWSVLESLSLLKMYETFEPGICLNKIFKVNKKMSNINY